MVGPLHWAVLSHTWNHVSVLCAWFILCMPEMVRGQQALWSRWTSTYTPSSYWKIPESVSLVPKTSFSVILNPERQLWKQSCMKLSPLGPFHQVKTKSLLAVEKSKLASQVRSVHVVSVTALCPPGLSSAWLRFHLHCGAVLTFIECILLWFGSGLRILALVSSRHPSF